MAEMKVYIWRGFRRKEEVETNFPEYEKLRWSTQTREMCAAESAAEVGRIVGQSPRSLDNLGITGNRLDISYASRHPKVNLWRPLDDRSGKWAHVDASE